MNIAVVGAGAWGTAIALHAFRQGHSVSLVPRRMDQALEIASIRENRSRLPGIEIPHGLQVGWQLRPVLMEAEVVFLATPSQGLAEACRQIAAHRDAARELRTVIALCKGLEATTHRLPGAVIASELPDLEVGVLSGPTSAAEVARGKPTAVTLATTGSATSREVLQEALSGEALRVYASDDVDGVELGGCLKNVYAIASGLVDGLGLGDNAKAALLTRSLAEMVRIGTTLGGRTDTFFGLSGFGDLSATCYGSWSRNRTFGEHLGRGQTAPEAIDSAAGVVEGFAAAENFQALCQARKIEAPILAEVFAICHQGRAPLEALGNLMRRDLRTEKIEASV